VPVPDHVAAFLVEHGPGDGPLVEVLARALTRAAGERVSPDELDLGAVPDHLRVTYRAVGPGGRALAWSKDLDALRAHLAPKVRETIEEVVARSAPTVQHTGLTSWSIGELPRTVTSEVDGRTVTAHPALVDEGESVGVRAYASPDEAAASHRPGLRRLLLLGIGDLGKRIRKGLPRDAELSLAGLGIPLGALFDDLAEAVVDASISSPGKVRDAEAFEALLLSVREDGVGRGLAAADVLARIGDRVRGLELRLAGHDDPAATDIRVQVAGLVHPGFVSEAGLDRLRDVERYLSAAEVRLDKLAADPGRDRRHQFLVQGLEDEWAAIADRDVGGKVRWMIEELRVSLFAQSLGTRGSISEQRVRKALAALRAAA
jgi:ATP-dependent helicase HrpA